MRAMKLVRDWEYTLRFGHLGTSQNSRANNARVVDYFCDSYEEQKEAVLKAELFLSIYDFIGRNAPYFARKGLVDDLGDGLFSVDPALLRSVHFVYTLPGRAREINPKKVFNLARAFQELEPAV